MRIEPTAGRTVEIPGATAHRIEVGPLTRTHATAPDASTAAVSPRRIGRRGIGPLVGASLLLYLAWTGVSGFVRQWPQAGDPWRMLQTLSELGYGAGALLCAVDAARPFRWAPFARGLWIVGATLAGGLAPVVYGGAPILVSLLTTVASAGLAVGLLQLVRRR